MNYKNVSKWIDIIIMMMIIVIGIMIYCDCYYDLLWLLLWLWLLWLFLWFIVIMIIMIIIMIKMKLLINQIISFNEREMRNGNEKWEMRNIHILLWINRKRIFFLLPCIKMNYYWFNRQEILQKAKERYSKKKSCRILFTKQRSYKRKVKRAL